VEGFLRSKRGQRSLHDHVARNKQKARRTRRAD
jgi:hypothetical protein